jgi:hypothetical protein
VNGRNHAVDALQEAVDLVAYAEAAGYPQVAAEAEGIIRRLLELLRG